MRAYVARLIARLIRESLYTIAHMRNQISSARSAARGRRPHRSESDAREHLLDTALRLFSERGIANTTVAEIARAGKVTSAMIHYWFDTREKLLDAIVEERLAPHMLNLWAPADEQHGSTLELIRALLMRMLEVTEGAPWLPSLWLREIIQEGGLLRERVLRRIPAERNALLAQAIARAQARGEINPDLVPGLVFFSMLGLVLLPQAGMRSFTRLNPRATPLDPGQLEKHVMALMMHGLESNAPGTDASQLSPR